MKTLMGWQTRKAPFTLLPPTLPAPRPADHARPVEKSDLPNHPYLEKVLAILARHRARVLLEGNNDLVALLDEIAREVIAAAREECLANEYPPPETPSGL